MKLTATIAFAIIIVEIGRTMETKAMLLKVHVIIVSISRYDE